MNQILSQSRKLIALLNVILSLLSDGPAAVLFIACAIGFGSVGTVGLLAQAIGDKESRKVAVGKDKNEQ